MIWQMIEDWFRGILTDGILSNLSGLFDSVNTEVGEIATQVGTTPAGWNAGIFNMIRFSGNPLKYTIKITSNKHNSFCVGIRFNVDKTNSGSFPFYSATSFNALTGLHRFRLIQYYGTLNSYHTWYPTLYDTTGVKQSSITIDFKTNISVSLIIAFELGDAASNRKVFSFINYGQTVSMALQYSGDNGNNWMDIRRFDVQYY